MAKKFHEILLHLNNYHIKLTLFGMIMINSACCMKLDKNLEVIISPAQQSCWGVHWFHSDCPSVPHPVSTLRRLQFWLDPFHIYTSYQATSEGVSHVKFFAKFEFWQFFKICNFDFVLFWLAWDLTWIAGMDTHGAAGFFLRKQAF